MLLRSTSAAPGACQRPRTVQRSMYRAAPRSRRVVVAEARLYVEPFNGCNCFYLLSKSKKGDIDGRKMVTDSLHQIKLLGFNVVRTWAFQDDDTVKGGTSNALQYMDATGKIVYNQDMLDGLGWLLNEARHRNLKLMLTLTNGNPHEYGGMRKYVWWARTRRNEYKGADKHQDLPNNAFFDTKEADEKGAQKLYEDYLSFIIKFINEHKYLDKDGKVIDNGFDVVHSWDICNEPRCKGDSVNFNSKVTTWIDKTAKFVKEQDAKHPVTVGLDGFFGSSTPELDSKNPYPYSPENDGCDFIENNKSQYLDFACIHLYPMNWRVQPPAITHRAEWGVKWIQDHLDAINNASNDTNGIPLVLQEFNLSRWDNEPEPETEYTGKPPKKCSNIPERTQMFKAISNLLVDHTKHGTGKFIGCMVWCISDLKCAEWNDEEQYYLYPFTKSQVDEAKQKPNTNPGINPELNEKQMQVLKDCSTKVNKLAAS